MYEIKTEDVYKDSCSDKKMFDFSNYSTKSKYYESSNKSVIGKMKDETGGVAIKEFVGLKSKMYSFLVDNSEHKKAKSVNENVVGTLSYNGYKDILLNKIGTYEIKKISLSCFDDKIYIQNNGYDGLTLDY